VGAHLTDQRGLLVLGHVMHLPQDIQVAALGCTGGEKANPRVGYLQGLEAQSSLLS
jgi:hypothetical protein